MRFSQIAKGLQARRRGVPFRTLDGQEVLVDIRIIGGEGQARILEYATAFAKKRGGEPRDGQALFEFGKAVMQCALGVLGHSPEKPGEDPCRTNPGDCVEPFFASPEEVLEACDRDRAMILAEHQSSLQSATSPLRHAMSDEEFYARVVELSQQQEGKEGSFFETLDPSLRLTFARSMASHLVAFWASQILKSSSSSKPDEELTSQLPTPENEND